MATVAQHRATNIHLADDPNQATFQARRDARDATLALPKLMLAAFQVSIRAGRVPDPEGNGRRFLKVPMDDFEERRPQQRVDLTGVRGM